MTKKLSKRKQKWIERTVANNRNYKLYLYNRFFLFLLLVLAQMLGYALAWYLFVYQTGAGLAVQFGVGILSWVAVLYLINKSDRPSTKLNWILLILIAPIFGLPTYLLFGEGRPTYRMKQKLDKARGDNRTAWFSSRGESEKTAMETRKDGVGSYLERVAGYPVFRQGDLKYYPSGEKMFADMLEALSQAKKYILLEYFIIAHGKMWQEILKILLQKAGEGVQIRIIYDDFGCMMTLPPKYGRYLESLHENIRCLSFNKVVPLFAVRMNNRDHRKMLVVDGETAFTGGVNLADEYIGLVRRFGHWKDTGLRIRGQAVGVFVRMFFDVWNAFHAQKEPLHNYLSTINSGDEDGEKRENGIKIQPYDDSPFDNVSVGESVYLDMINSATEYLYIFTPYLILDDLMRAALCLAAARGVDVRIVTPGVPDKKTIYRMTRANYPLLMKSGVKIYEYTPGFIHAKSVLCDGDCAVVGTINFDYRSLYHHFENGVYFQNSEVLQDLKRDCEETFALSTLCTMENTKRGVFGRILDSLLRVFETLL